MKAPMKAYNARELYEQFVNGKDIEKEAKVEIERELRQARRFTILVIAFGCLLTAALLALALFGDLR